MNRFLFGLVIVVLAVGCSKPSTPKRSAKAKASKSATKEKVDQAGATAADRFKPEQKSQADVKDDVAAKGTTENKATDPAEEIKTVQQARDEVQSRIDRYLGGVRDTVPIGGTFGIWQVTRTVSNIEIVRVGQAYHSNGRPRTNTFVVVFKCTATRNATGEKEEKEFQFELNWLSGKWW